MTFIQIVIVVFGVVVYVLFGAFIGRMLSYKWHPDGGKGTEE